MFFVKVDGIFIQSGINVTIRSKERLARFEKRHVAIRFGDFLDSFVKF